MYESAENCNCKKCMVEKIGDYFSMMSREYETLIKLYLLPEDKEISGEFRTDKQLYKKMISLAEFGLAEVETCHSFPNNPSFSAKASNRLKRLFKVIEERYQKN